MTRELTEGRADRTIDYFREFNAPRPVIDFEPAVGQLRNPNLDTLFTYWTSLRDSRRRDGLDLPAQMEFDPLEVSATLPYVMLLDVVNEGADFRYRVYGREIAERFGRDLTGLLLSETAVDPYIAAFFRAVYLASMARREPVLTEHAPPQSVMVASWRRLILPLAGGDGRVTRFVVGNIPGPPRAGIPDQRR
ncbi:PAS domain-containing protein [Marivibrio halodurans]|uniref:PAS domain-containing protein n=1 Tax=Marivibrio halodurans TaxID=2039722 RepID=A0A8J7V226_9PROT|nr:PAS domain-containing protein [Marivibrio halodurans]MBP5856422.1 PAS domain-containing protein [Marivibrio halodurans]